MARWTTYVIRGESFSSWILIDSGNDVDGRMATVAEKVRTRFGPIDFVLGNLRPFGITNPLYITGGGHYWLCLTPEQMRRFHEMKEDWITLTPPGVAEVCSIAGARYFLPYAHSWVDFGQIPEGDEARLAAELEQEITRVGAGTQVLSWKVGDQLRVRGARNFDFAAPMLGA